MIKETRLVNEKTGQVVSTNVTHIAAAFHEEKGYLFWARKSFTKSFQDVPYPDGMTDTEIGQMARLAKCVWSNTNMLGYRGNGGVLAYDTPGIAKVLKVGKRRAQQFVAKMIRLGMLARVEIETEDSRDVQFYVNPIYFFSSNRIPLNLYLIFRAQLDANLPDWVKDQFKEVSLKNEGATK